MNRSRAIVTVIGVLGTALFAHVLIDLAGDRLLAHDTYDDVAHGSRGASALVLVASALVALAALIRAALVEAAGDEGALLRALRAARASSGRVEWARVAALAVPLVAAMEALDAWSAGRPCDDVVDLLGGSLALGLTAIAVAAAIVSGAVRIALAAAAGAHGRLVALAVAFAVLADVEASDGCTLLHARASRRSARRTVHRRRVRGRAPPASPSLAASA